MRERTRNHSKSSFNAALFFSLAAIFLAMFAASDFLPCSAHRFLAASAMRLCPAALILRFWGGWGTRRYNLVEYRWRGAGGDAPSAESEAFVAAYREAQARAQRYGREICFSAARAGLLTNHFCSLSQ